MEGNENSIVIGGGLLTSILAWFLKVLYNDNKSFQKAAWLRIDATEASLNDHKTFVAGHCATRPEIDKLREHIDYKFESLTRTIINQK